MTYKNSLKLLASNFGVVWKHLVYLVISGAICLGLIFAFSNPLINLLRESGWVSAASSLIETIYTEPTIIFDVIKKIILSFFEVISLNFSSIWYSVIGLFLTGYLIPGFLFGVGFYNVSSVMQKQMTSMLTVGYTQNMLSTFRTGSKYALMKVLIILPFDVIKILLLVAFFRLATSFIYSILFLSLLCALLILIHSLQITVVSCFAPFMIDTSANPFKSFFKSTVPMFKQFKKTFSNAIMIVLTCLFVNMLLSLFTVFSGLIITLPATAVLVAIFGNVVYLSCNAKRYYLNKSVIVNTALTDNKEDKKFDDMHKPEVQG